MDDLPATRRIPLALAAVTLLVGPYLTPAAIAFPPHTDSRMFLGSPGAARHVRYEGVLHLEGHYKRPGETRRYQSIREFWTDGKDRMRLEWMTWVQGDSSAEPETYLMIGKDVYHRDSPSAKWKYLHGDRCDVARFQLLAAAPWLVEKPPSTRQYTRSDGQRSYERAKSHPRLGDVRDSVGFEYSPADVPVPGRVRMVLYERDANWRLDEEITWRDGKEPADSFLAVPPWFEPEYDEPDSIVPDPPVFIVAPGVWSIDMKDLGSRTLVVEFGDHLAVIEAAIGSANGERIVDVLKKRWPLKPIRYFFFSHHHPHYAGGLRAFIAEGAMVITTPGNESVVRAAAARPFTIHPDRLALAPRIPEVRLFTKRFELADSTNQLIAIDIGDRSDHTAEFTIFWLPRQRVVFETEQGWVTVDGKLRASRRAKSFLGTLDQEGVRADRLVQSWPMRGEPASLSRAELEALILARGR